MRRRRTPPSRASDRVDPSTRAELYRIVGFGGEADTERGVDDLARAVCEANAILGDVTTAAVVEESMAALLAHDTQRVDDLGREARRRRLLELPDPILRAFLAAYDPRRRGRLDGRTVDTLTLACGAWLGNDARYFEILEELPPPREAR